MLTKEAGKIEIDWLIDFWGVLRRFGDIPAK